MTRAVREIEKTFSHYMGVDLGSTTAKTVIVDDTGRIVSSAVVQMGAVSRAGLARSMTSALEAAALGEADVAATIATGYGRRLVPGVGRTFTEITCHARGVAAMCPGTRLVVRYRGPGQQGDPRRPAGDRRELRDERPLRQRHRAVLRGAGPSDRVRHRRSGPARADRGPGPRSQQHVRDVRGDRDHLAARARGDPRGHRGVGAPRGGGPHAGAGGAGRQARPRGHDRRGREERRRRALPGEQLAAVIRLNPGAGRPSPGDLRAFCRAQMSAHKTPAYWSFVETMPVTPTGKIQKFVLRDQLSAGALPAEPVTREVRS